jgi:hypothetical protein
MLSLNPLFRKHAANKDRREGNVQVCENCREARKVQKGKNKNMTYVKSAKNLLCKLCLDYWRRKNTHRPLLLVKANEKRQKIKKAIENGTPLQCCFCAKVTPHLIVSMLGVGPYCEAFPCKEKRRAEEKKLQESQEAEV